VSVSTIKPPLRDVGRVSRELAALPPYVFAELDRLRTDARQRGLALIDLGIGSPDKPTPQPIVEAMQRATADPGTHGYPPFRGVKSFLESASSFMHRRFGVSVDPATDILALAGAKEGIAQIIAATVGSGDVVLVPEIFYPVYARAAQLAGAQVRWVPMRASTGFLADFDAVPREVIRRSRILIVNYPNNPTGTIAERDYFMRAVAFAQEHGLMLISDLAYSQLTYDGFVAPSVLEIPGASGVAVEFHSCSKSFNMAGHRVGFAVGGEPLISALAAYRTNVGYGAPTVVQYGGAYAFDHYSEMSSPIAERYRTRRDAIVAAMRRTGREAEAARGAMYLWMRIPEGVDDWTFVKTMMEDAHVVVTPGVAFGPGGAGYYRISLVAEPNVLETAVEKIDAACNARGWR
jgi:LL-diaminopimelate aminotransferase